MNTKPKKQWLAIAAVLIITLVLGAFILMGSKSSGNGEEHAHQESEAGEHKDKGHKDEADKSAKGPHGGKLLRAKNYSVEVTIQETGGEPQFRLYTFLGGKPVDPGLSQIQLSVQRLGQAPQQFTFRKEADYLVANSAVEEPHSFEVKIAATYAGKTHELGYEQIEGRIAMSDEQLKSAGVALAAAGPAKIGTTLRLLGEVKYNSDRTVQIVPRLAGLVEQVRVSAGDTVRKGQVMAVLSSQSLADQRAELLAAQQRLSLARTTYERERKLWEEKITPEQDMLSARSSMQEASIAVQSAQNKSASLGGTVASGSLTRYELRSPIDGVVTEKHISLGEVVKEDSAVFTVSDLSSVWVEAPVSVPDLGGMAVGQPVTVRANGFDASATGKVAYISALVGEQTRSAMVRTSLANPKGLWRPGLPVTLEVLLEEKEVPVAISAQAVQDLGSAKVVFGRYGESLEARPLELGRSDGKLVEVLGGLTAGERYAATNSFVVKAELGKAGAGHAH